MNSTNNPSVPTSIASLGDAAAALQLGLPSHAHPTGTPTSMHSYFNNHQDYLNRLHASAALAADQQARAGLNRNSRKRALSGSYSEIDLTNLIRHSPTSLQLLNAAANGGSPSSSGSYGHLSGNFISFMSFH